MNKTYYFLFRLFSIEQVAIINNIFNGKFKLINSGNNTFMFKMDINGNNAILTVLREYINIEEGWNSHFDANNFKEINISSDELLIIGGSFIGLLYGTLSIIFNDFPIGMNHNTESSSNTGIFPLESDNILIDSPYSSDNAFVEIPKQSFLFSENGDLLTNLGKLSNFDFLKSRIIKILDNDQEKLIYEYQRSNGLKINEKSIYLQKNKYGYALTFSKIIFKNLKELKISKTPENDGYRLISRNNVLCTKYFPYDLFNFKIPKNLVNVSDNVVLIKYDKHSPRLRLNNTYKVINITNMRSSKLVELLDNTGEIYTTDIKNIKKKNESKTVN